MPRNDDWCPCLSLLHTCVLKIFISFAAEQRERQRRVFVWDWSRKVFFIDWLQLFMTHPLFYLLDTNVVAVLQYYDDLMYWSLLSALNTVIKRHGVHLLDAAWQSRRLTRVSTCLHRSHGGRLSVTHELNQCLNASLSAIVGRFVYFCCYSAADRGAEYNSIVMSVSVWVSVCVCLSAIISSELHSNLHHIFVYVTCGRGSVLLWLRSDILCTSGFTDDVIFAHKPKLLDVAAQLKRSADEALGLATNYAQ